MPCKSHAGDAYGTAINVALSAAAADYFHLVDFIPRQRGIELLLHGADSLPHALAELAEVSVDPGFVSDHVVLQRLGGGETKIRAAYVRVYSSVSVLLRFV